MAFFYHYTAFSNLRSIFKGGEDWHEPGLRPMRRFLSLRFSAASQLPDQAHENATFGVLEPFPRAWVAADPFLSGKSHLEESIRERREGVVCLECHAPDDHVFVTERAVFFGQERTLSAHKSEQEQQDFLTEACRAYWQKLIPLTQYQQQEQNYILPEVITFKRIPPSRLKIKKHYEDRSAFLEDLKAHRLCL